MARLVDIIIKYRVGLHTIIDFLNSLGAGIQYTKTGGIPSYYVPEELIPYIHNRFSSVYEQYELDDFCARVTRDVDGRVNSILFSNSINHEFRDTVPSIILTEANSHNYGMQEKNGWLAYVTECGKQFKLIKVSLGHFNEERISIIVDENNRILYTLQETRAFGFGVSCSIFSDGILEVVDKRCVDGVKCGEYSKTDYQIKTYFDFLGNVLLKTKTPLQKSERELTSPIKLPTGDYLMNDSGKWSLYNTNLSFIRELSLFDNKLLKVFIIEESRVFGFTTYTSFYSGIHANGFYLFDEGWNLLYYNDVDVDSFYHLKNTSLNVAWLHSSPKNKECIVFSGKEYQYNLIADWRKLESFADGTCACVAYISIDGQKKYGIVDRTQLLLPFMFDSIEMNDDTQTAIVYTNKKKGIVRSNGDVIIPPLYSDIMAVGNFYIVSTHGLFPTEFMSRYDGSGQYKTAINEGGKYYIIKANGDYSINDSFSDIHIEPNDFSRRISTIGEPVDDANYAIFHVLKEGSSIPRYGIVDIDGTILIEPIYTNLRFLRNIESSSNNKRYIAFSRHGSQEWIQERNTYFPFIATEGLMDFDKNVILPDSYSSVEIFGQYVRTRIGTKYGLCSLNGKKLIDNRCTFISFMACGDETNVACFNIDGKLDIPNEHRIDYSVLDKIYCAYIEKKAPATIYLFAYKSMHESIIGGKWGYINLKRGIKGEAIYDEVHSFWRDRAIVKKDGLYYLINWDLAIVGGPYSMARVGQYRSSNYMTSEIEYTSGESASSGKYGAYNGYDDDTIDSAFEGMPEATWNVE